MTRGEVAPVAIKGDYGKPRPALVIQDDVFQALASRAILPITTTLHDAPWLRVRIDPTARNGLRAPSEVMIDKVQTVDRARLRDPVGHLDAGTLGEIDRRLALFLGIG